MYNPDEFIEDLDIFWEDLENDRFDFVEEEIRFAADIIKRHPRAFEDNSGEEND